MKEKVFKIIDKINREGLDNGEWGLLHGCSSTKDYFGVIENIPVEEDFLWVYEFSDKLYGFICWTECKSDIILHSDCDNEKIHLFKL